MTTPTKLTSPDQIPALPWTGNHHSDMQLLFDCEALIRTLAPTDRPGARRALYLMSNHGMGITDRVTDRDLTMFLAEIS